MSEHSTQRLARRLNTQDAVVIGLGAMIGAGLFAVPGPAAAAAGTWMLLGLVLASVVAYANARSSAQLAIKYPESGGTYVYARKQLGSYWGFLAGWCFVIGKVASLSAMALTFGIYIHEDFGSPLGVGAVAALTVVNYFGIERTVRLTRVLVVLILTALAIAVAAAIVGSNPSIHNLTSELPQGLWGVLQSAGLLFFAFAGYARIATLGEEVLNPETTIPRAISIALAVTVALYAVVLTAALLAVGPTALAGSSAPLVELVSNSNWEALTPIVRAGAAIAAAGVLLSLLAGVSRTALSMARRQELRSYLASIHPRHHTPYWAEITIAAIVCTVVMVADLRNVIGFSSFAVLTYYGLANASAWKLSVTEHQKPRYLAGLGIVLCALLAVTLPRESVLGGMVLVAVGTAVWFATGRHRIVHSG